MSHYPRRLLPAIANNPAMVPPATSETGISPAPAPAQTQTQFARPAPHQLRILLVEDSATSAAVLTNTLFEAFSQRQLAIWRVPTLAEARRLTLPDLAGQAESGTRPFGEPPISTLAKPLTFDLIILDVTLPDGSGYQLCRELKANPATAVVPVVMFSEQSLADLGETAIEAGANYCISKGRTGGEQTLLLLVARLLEERQ